MPRIRLDLRLAACSRNTRTDIVPDKQIRAISLDARVPLLEVRGTDTLALLNSVAAITALDQIVLVTIRDNARLLRLRAFRRRRGSLGCCARGSTCSRRTWNGDAVVISEIELRAIGFDSRIPGYELRDAEGSIAVGDDLAGITGYGFVVFPAGGDDASLGRGRTG